MGTMTDDPHRIRKLIRPRLPYSWLDEYWELLRYLLTLAIVFALLGLMGLVVWLRTGGL